MTNSTATLLSLLFLWSTVCAAKEHLAPLPAKLLTAKITYIENRGHSKIADRACNELQKWGRSKVVDSPGAAEIILQLSDQPGESASEAFDLPEENLYPGSIEWSNAETPGHTHITIVDPKSGKMLYSDRRQSGYKSAMREIPRDLRNRIEEQEKASALH